MFKFLSPELVIYMQLIAYSGFILRLLYKISQGKDVETYIASYVGFIFKIYDFLGSSLSKQVTWTT